MKDIILSLIIHVANPINVQFQKTISQYLLFYLVNHGEGYRGYFFKKVKPLNRAT